MIKYPGIYMTKIYTSVGEVHSIIDSIREKGVVIKFYAIVKIERLDESESFYFGRYIVS